MIKFCATIAGVSMLAACSQQVEPTVVSPEPVYNKFGDGSCRDGWVYVRGSTTERDDCLPPDECDPVFDAAGNVLDCIRFPRQPDPMSDESDPGRSPLGTTTAAGQRS